MPKIAQSKYDAQQTWEENISRAKKVRKNWKDLFRVDLAVEYFDGKQNPGYPDEEWITLNKVYSHLKAQLPSLYSADPYFYVKVKRSYKPEVAYIQAFEQKAATRQAMLNYLKEELELKAKVRLCIQDAHFKYGVIKIHHTVDEVENKDAGMPIIGESGEVLYDDNGGEILEPETIPVNERYRITRVHPDDFIWDEDAGPLSDSWKWVAERIRMPLETLKQDKRYNKQALKALEGKGEALGEEEKRREDRKKGGDVSGKTDRKDGKKRTKNEPEIVALWEIYEIEKKRYHVIVEDGEIPLLYNEPTPKGIENHPYSILRFTLRDDSPYQHPPMSPGLDPQREYNVARSRIMTHRKRFNRKYEVYMQGLSSEEEASKLESGDDGTLIRKLTSEKCINPIQDAPLDQQGYLELNFLNKDIIELMGGSHDETRGIAGAESATQAGILEKRLEMKEGDAMSMVIDFVRDIARKLDQLVQAYITQDEAVRITGPEGERWAQIRVQDYEEIEGEFEYSVNVGATIPSLPHVERSQWIAFLTLLGGFPHLLLSPQLMKRMAEMHHIEDEAMLKELLDIGQKIMAGQMPMPGAGGSQKGVGEDRPVSAVGGQAGGISSLMSPGGGT